MGETGEERERDRREGERYSDYALTHTLVHSVHGFVSVCMCGTIYAAIIQGPVVCTFSGTTVDMLHSETMYACGRHN